jgi:hypothetical protein
LIEAATISPQFIRNPVGGVRVCVKLTSAMQSISAACLSIVQTACSGVRVRVKLTSTMQSISAAPAAWATADPI